MIERGWHPSSERSAKYSLFEIGSDPRAPSPLVELSEDEERRVEAGLRPGTIMYRLWSSVHDLRKGLLLKLRKDGNPPTTAYLKYQKERSEVKLELHRLYLRLFDSRNEISVHTQALYLDVLEEER